MGATTDPWQCTRLLSRHMSESRANRMVSPTGSASLLSASESHTAGWTAAEWVQTNDICWRRTLLRHCGCCLEGARVDEDALAVWTPPSREIKMARRSSVGYQVFGARSTWPSFSLLATAVAPIRSFVRSFCFHPPSAPAELSHIVHKPTTNQIRYPRQHESLLIPRVPQRERTLV